MKKIFNILKFIVTSLPVMIIVACFIPLFIINHIRPYEATVIYKIEKPDGIVRDTLTVDCVKYASCNVKHEFNNLYNNDYHLVLTIGNFTWNNITVSSEYPIYIEYFEVD